MFKDYLDRAAVVYSTYLTSFLLDFVAEASLFSIRIRRREYDSWNAALTGCSLETNLAEQ